MRDKNLDVILGQKDAKNAFFVLSYEFNDVCNLVRFGKIIGKNWKFWGHKIGSNWKISSLIFGNKW